MRYAFLLLVLSIICYSAQQRIRFFTDIDPQDERSLVLDWFDTENQIHYYQVSQMRTFAFDICRLGCRQEDSWNVTLNDEEWQTLQVFANKSLEKKDWDLVLEFLKKARTESDIYADRASNTKK